MWSIRRESTITRMMFGGPGGAAGASPSPHPAAPLSPYFAISFALIASIFLNLGVNTFLMREVARKPADGPRLLANAMSLKLGLAVELFLQRRFGGRQNGLS